MSNNLAATGNGAAAPVSVTIVNKNYPPYTGVTGESANELAEFLIRERNIRVKVVHTKAAYGRRTRDVQGFGEHVEVRSLYNGKQKLLRLFASLLESYFLVRKAVKVSEGPVIVMTDPPFLSFWSSILLKRRTWMYWSMDIYPDGFAAANLTSPQNGFYKYIRKTVYRNPPDFIIGLGRQQVQFLLQQYQTDIPFTELPCGIVEMETGSSHPEWRTDPSKIYLGYCGNIGEAHSATFVKEVIRQLDPEKHSFLLSCYGLHAEDLKTFAANYPAVHIVDGVKKTELKYIDVHLVTLIGKWNHICVPSKAFTAVCSGAPILFCGTQSSDNWYYLANAAWFIDEDRDMQTQIKQFLNRLSHEELSERKENSMKLYSRLTSLKQKAFNDIADYIANAQSNTVKKPATVTAVP